MENPRYPIGMQSFADLRQGGYLYVDKTLYIKKMIDGSKYYFLSRPRRFGKSLFMSTVEAYFKGRKELFRGLYIERFTDEWSEYPVIHFDMSARAYSSEDDLLSKLEFLLSNAESELLGRTLEGRVEDRFSTLIRQAREKTGKKVVVLIDEYDKPLLETINDPRIQNHYRDCLRGFYTVLKSMDPCLEFVMLTGVTKFGAMSIFSGLNNLNDISLDDAYAGICGITEEELLRDFNYGIHDLAVAYGMSEEEMAAELKHKYDGYHFAGKSPDIYNPFCLMQAFEKRKMSDFWFASGTPKFLADILQKEGFKLQNLEECQATPHVINDVDIAFDSPIGVLYQTGYLTIKGYNLRSDIYTLGFPNLEIRKSFLEYLLPRYASLQERDTAMAINKFIRDLNDGDAEAFTSSSRGLDRWIIR